MPLPTGDMLWPPTDERVQSNLADWSAWYSSNPISLQERYAYAGWRHGSPYQQQPRTRGFLGWLQRWFWGTETPHGQKITKLHIPLAADMASVSAGMLFSEPPAIRVEDAKTTQDAIDKAIDGGLHATLLEAADACSGIGGSYLRIVWDRDVTPLPWIAPVQADCAVPEFAYGTHLRAVTFWTDVHRDGETVWRHLERHEKGRILHGLYEGSPTRLGMPVPLTEQPATAPLAALVDDQGGIDTGAPDHLTAAYVPNMRPARVWRDCPAAAGLGQSDYAGVEPLMDALDETYTSWMRDIRLGKARLVVPNSMLESGGPGRGAEFLEDRELYTGLNFLPRAGDSMGSQLESVQFKIRFEEHHATAADLIEQILGRAGYSGASFGLDAGGAAMTATEITAREGKSITTRNRKTLYWKPAIKDIVAAWLAVCAGPVGNMRGLEVTEPTVEFADGVADSPQEMAQTAQLLRTAQAASTETLVRMLHPEWDDLQVTAETQRITDEHDLGQHADPARIGQGGFDLTPAEQPNDGGGDGPAGA